MERNGNRRQALGPSEELWRRCFAVTTQAWQAKAYPTETARTKQLQRNVRRRYRPQGYPGIRSKHRELKIALRSAPFMGRARRCRVDSSPGGVAVETVHVWLAPLDDTANQSPRYDGHRNASFNSRRKSNKEGAWRILRAKVYRAKRSK